MIRQPLYSSRSPGPPSMSSTVTEGGTSENFSRDFSSPVLSGFTTDARDALEETSPMAIVLDTDDPTDHIQSSLSNIGNYHNLVLNTTNGNDNYIPNVMSVHRVKKEEVETKINVWQNAKIAKINNRFKREEVILNAWEEEQVQKANSSMRKVERKLEEERVKAHEKMENDIIKAHKRAEERRASAEAKRGMKIAQILDISNLMRLVGRPPIKRSFF